MSSGRDKIDAGAWGGRLGTAARKRWKRREERSKNQQRAEDNIGEQRRTEACTQSTHTKYFITKENKTHEHTHKIYQNLNLVSRRVRISSFKRRSINISSLLTVFENKHCYIHVHIKTYEFEIKLMFSSMVHALIKACITVTYPSIPLFPLPIYLALVSFLGVLRTAYILRGCSNTPNYRTSRSH